MLISHGAGNIGSLVDMFHQVGYHPHLAQSPSQLDNASMVVLPGVGASGSVMARLRDTGFADALLRINECQLPIVGICVGAQIMFQDLQENECNGLGLLPGEVTRIEGGSFNNGWAAIRLAPSKDNTAEKSKYKVARPLLLKTAAKTFYFNHGYQIKTPAQMHELATTTCSKKLLAYFVHDNLCGIQFHPEKSQATGLAFIANTMKHYGF